MHTAAGRSTRSAQCLLHSQASHQAPKLWSIIRHSPVPYTNVQVTTYLSVLLGLLLLFEQVCMSRCKAPQGAAAAAAAARSCRMGKAFFGRHAWRRCDCGILPRVSKRLSSVTTGNSCGMSLSSNPYIHHNIPYDTPLRLCAG